MYVPAIWFDKVIHHSYLTIVESSVIFCRSPKCISISIIDSVVTCYFEKITNWGKLRLNLSSKHLYIIDNLDLQVSSISSSRIINLLILFNFFLIHSNLIIIFTFLLCFTFFFYWCTLTIWQIMVFL